MATESHATRKNTTRTGPFRAILALLLIASAISAIKPAPAEAANGCGYTSLKQSTFNAGIWPHPALFRHEARGYVCNSGNTITKNQLETNRIVKVGIGTLYGNSTWNNNSGTGTSTEWMKAYGQGGMTVTIGGVTFGISRTHFHKFSYTGSGGSVTYAYTNSNWWL